MATTVILVGPPGSGKTTLATALSDELANRRRPHGLVELDALGQAHPPLPARVAIAHLASVVAELRANGRHLVIVTATPETRSELHSIARATGGGDDVVFALDAPPDVLGRRLVDREPEPWQTMLISITERVHADLARIAGPGATTIDTSKLTVREAMARILDRLERAPPGD